MDRDAKETKKYWCDIVIACIVNLKTNKLYLQVNTENRLQLTAGGHVQYNEDIYAAITRELMEETGITISVCDLIKTFSNELVSDWLNLFYALGLEKNRISMRQKEYERQWGDLLVKGKTTFYYYDDIELGDTTFFNSITKDGKHFDLETMSDVGFGLERIRWVSSQRPYFDLYTSSKALNAETKALLSALALLAVNGVKASNKNSGYRARLFSKKLVNVLGGVNLSDMEMQYLNECLTYWTDWQEKTAGTDISLIINEYMRNCNRFILDHLVKKGYDNIAGIDINLARTEFKNRLKNANVNDLDIGQYEL